MKFFSVLAVILFASMAYAEVPQKLPLLGSSVSSNLEIPTPDHIYIGGGINFVKNLSLADFLQKEQSISSFQLLTHGRPGQLLIEGKWLGKEEIAVFLSKILSSSITQVNIYGCEFAKGETGKTAVSYLQSALGVSIAASDDITGKDGDWILEIGNVDASILKNVINSNLQYKADEDFDQDGIVNYVDIDDDNDGVLDVVECPKTAITERFSSPFPWRGSTNSTVTRTIMTDGITNVVADPPVTGRLSKVGSENNYTIDIDITHTYQIRLSGDPDGQGTIKFTFSPGIPASELAFVIADVDRTTYPSGPRATFKINNQDPSSAFSTNFDYYRFANYAMPTTNSGGIVTFTVPINGNPSNPANPAQSIAVVGKTSSLVTSLEVSFLRFSDQCSFRLLSMTSPPCDLDGDNISNDFDLDTDADGCPDAVEAAVFANVNSHGGLMSSGTLVNPSGTTPGTVNSIVGTGDPVEYGTNGFYSVIESNNTRNATYINASYTYQYATSYRQGACNDYDKDNLPDLVDLDDDNDGILDIPEGLTPCVPILKYEEIPNFTFAKIKKVEPLSGNNFDFVNNGFEYNGGGINSTFDGTLDNTGFNAAYEWKPTTHDNKGNGLRYTLVGKALSGANKLMLINDHNWDYDHEDGMKSFTIVLRDANNAVLGSETFQAIDKKTYQMFTFTGNYSNISAFDLVVNNTFLRAPLEFSEIALGGRNPEIACIESMVDSDLDRIPNHLDLDSDGDGCSDVIEGGSGFDAEQEQVSDLPGGNKGPEFNGSYNQPVRTNLGNNVGTTAPTMGVPLIAIEGVEVGQTIGTSQDTARKDPSCKNGPIAVSWISTTVAQLNNDAVVNWKVSEQNVSHYIVQRSVNGQAFTDLGTVAASTNADLTKSYSFTDMMAASQGASLLVYRVVSVDYDGSQSISTEASIRLTNAKAGIKLYPNPSRGMVNFSSLNKVKQIEFYNAVGARVKQIAVSNSSILGYDVSNLAAGIYFVRLISADGQATNLKVELMK